MGAQPGSLQQSWKFITYLILVLWNLLTMILSPVYHSIAIHCSTCSFLLILSISRQIKVLMLLIDIIVCKQLTHPFCWLSMKVIIQEVQCHATIDSGLLLAVLINQLPQPSESFYQISLTEKDFLRCSFTCVFSYCLWQQRKVST